MEPGGVEVSPTVRVVLMVLRGEELLLAERSGVPRGFELPSTDLVAGDSFAAACRRVVVSEGLPETVEPELQRFANVRTTRGKYEIHVGFLVVVPPEFARPDTDPRGRFFPLSALPATLDGVTRNALASLSRQESVVDLDDGDLGPVGTPDPPGAFDDRATTTADDDRVTTNPHDDRVSTSPDHAPEVFDDRVTTNLLQPPPSSHRPPLPFESAGAFSRPIAPFTLWFAGALLWMTAVALVFEHHQALPTDVVWVAWGSLAVSALLFISRASLPRARDEDPPPFKRWALTLGVGLATLFGVAMLMSVFASPLRAGQAYLMLGVLGMGLFFVARNRAQSSAPAVQRGRAANAARFVVWLVLVLLSLLMFAAAPA
jgi:hypothetical protein